MADNPNIYDRILSYLYQRQNEIGWINLFNDELLSHADKPTIREKARELEQAGRIGVKPNGLRIISGEGRTTRERREANEKFDAKIKLPGIEYIDQINNVKEVKQTKIEVTGQVGNINTGDIKDGGQLTQLSEDLSLKKKEIKKQVKHPVENPKRKMNGYEKWTIILTVFSIIVTIVLKMLDLI